MAFNFQEAFQQALQKTMPAKNKSRSASIAWQEAMQNQPKAPTLPAVTAAPPSWGQEAFKQAKAAALAGQGGWGQGGWGQEAFERAKQAALEGYGERYGGLSPNGSWTLPNWGVPYPPLPPWGRGGGGGGGGGGIALKRAIMDWLRPWEEFRTGQPTTQPYFAEWLEAMRPQLQRQYLGQLPPELERTRGTTAGETTESWRQWLQDKLAQNAPYQQWWRLPPEERGMYYGRMAPRMRQMAGI